MGRNQVRVMVDRTGVDLIAACRLDTDKGQAKAQAGNHHATATEHRVGLRRAPAFAHGVLVGLWQTGKCGQVLIQRHALGTRPLVEAGQVIADAA
ncbi:hypothetical protein D3C86_2048540 [compost metagenome]